MSKHLISLVARLPTIEIPYEQACKRYGGVVARLLEDLSQSAAKEPTKQVPPHEMTWLLAYDRASDPPRVTDAEAFTRYLSANSKAYLKVLARAHKTMGGGSWVGVEELHITPPQIMALYEQRSRLVCGQRVDHPDNEAEEGTDLDIPRPQPLSNGEGLPDVLLQWFSSHPQADKRLFAVAMFTAEQLEGSAAKK